MASKCKPTVGEVRECTCAYCATVSGEPVKASPETARWRDLEFDRRKTRIVEVAPCNRAKVTAGPPWMR